MYVSSLSWFKAQAFKNGLTIHKTIRCSIVQLFTLLMLKQCVTHSRKAADREQLVCQAWCSPQVSSHVCLWRRCLPRTPLEVQSFHDCWPLLRGVAQFRGAGQHLHLLLIQINIHHKNYKYGANSHAKILQNSS